MNYLGYLSAFLIIALVGSIGLYFPWSDAATPPTRAFSKIFVAGQQIISNSYNSWFGINTAGDLSVSAANNTATIKLKPNQCAPGLFIYGVDNNGNFLCR